MFLPLSQWRPAGFWIACTALLLVWLASAAGALESINAWAYRQYHSLPALARPEPGVTLIRADFEQLQPADWQQVLAGLRAMQPAAIGLLQRPSDWAGIDAGLDEATRRLLVLPGEEVLVLPPSQQAGQLAWHQPQIGLPAGPFTTLEARVAAQAQGSAVAQQRFLIDFRPGGNYLPQLDVGRLLAADLPAGLVAGKVVLIGAPLDIAHPPLFTPLNEDARVSRLMHAGYVVDTLLRGQPLQALQRWQDALLSLGLIALAALLYRQFGIVRISAIRIAGSLLLFVAGGLALQLGGRVLPVAELVALHLLLWSLLSRLEQQRDWETISQLVRSQSSHLHQRLVHRDFNSSDDPWGQVLQLCIQLLSLERAILLELEPGRKHVREVKAWRCSIDDIGERRRDYHRTPYSTALELRGPILLDKEYLKDPQPDCREFMVPMQFNGELQGFLSGEVAQVTLDKNPLFMHLLAECADKIGELLYRRRVWQEREQRESRSWWRLLQLSHRRDQYHSLVQVSRLFERRLALLENVVANLETSTVLYDLFGQVSQVNRAMEALASRADLPIFNMTAADTLAALSDMPLARAHEHLQHMLLTRESLCFSAHLQGDDSTWLLYIRPLQADDGRSQQQDINPFRIQGFLLELVDVSHLVRLGQLKDEVGNRINAELRNQLETALLTAELCGQPDLPANDRAQFQQLLTRKLGEVVQTLQRSQQMVQAVRDVSQLSDFPLHARTLLADTARRWRQRLADQGMQLELDSPELTAFVRVDVARIAPTLDALIRVLVEDNREGGILRLSLAERTQDGQLQVFIRLQNNGYGLPDDHLQALLSGQSSAPSPSIHRLQQAVEQLGHWGGRVSGHSSLGQGIGFEIQLPATQLGAGDAH